MLQVETGRALIIHDKELVLNTGADLYLPKPYEIPNLIKWVNEFIKEFNL